ncbi:MAG: hypothetical protein H0X17_14585 [Deltaproteobacteria bacterium]|nr:hypothetical protein [Deltaproteobacteria bacterium]
MPRKQRFKPSRRSKPALITTPEDAEIMGHPTSASAGDPQKGNERERDPELDK